MKVGRVVIGDIKKTFCSKKLRVSSGVFIGGAGSFVCDDMCNKAFSIEKRPIDSKGYIFSDHELGDAPVCLGNESSVGGKKPQLESEKHNKWCYMECERLIFVDDTDSYFEMKKRVVGLFD